MSDTFSSILAQRLQETGGNSGSWGTKLNTEALQYLEDKVAGVTTINTTGGTTTLTAAQGRCNIIKVTGTLVSNVAIVVPNVTNAWYIDNLTVHGNFAVAVQTAVPVVAHDVAYIPPDGVKKVYCLAATQVARVDDGIIGTVFETAYGMSPPSGSYPVVSSATVVSRTGVYREIFRIYGTTYGSGDGSLTFNLPLAPSGGTARWGLAGTSAGTLCMWL